MESIKCSYCNKYFLKTGIKTHIWRAHGEGKNHKPFSGKIPHNKGVPTSEEVKEKIRISNKNNLNNTGRAKTDKAEIERKRKISENGKGKIGGYREGSGRGKKGWYKGYWCDSSWELAFVIYNLEHDISFARNNQKFKYEFEGKKLHYIPDFIMEDGTYVEIKNYATEKTNAKHNQFPHKLNVICGFKEIQVYLDYVELKYGKDFIRLYE